MFKPSNDVLECKFCLGNNTVMSGYYWQESMKHTVVSTNISTVVQVLSVHTK